MRNLKKILALVLALMMALSVMVFASAANYDDYSDKDQISEEYAEAVEVLTGMDIVWGVGDNNFAPKDNVARADVATLLYRIVTTDVDGNQVGIYKDYGMFDDVLETNWFAGYVNYAANNELVVGVGDGKFNPKGNVTGYEWITMLLRAIGYDQNNEISGSDWKITAAGLAQKAGILDGFNQSTLNSALTREQVVYLLFNAINVPQVTYTPALGYETDDLFGNVNESIGEENFGLDSRAGADTWGRPGVEWYDSRLAANNVYAFVEEEPIITYDEAVTECDIAAAVGLRTRDQYDVYLNGANNKSYYTVNAVDTITKIGAQGRLTEVYEDRIVMIDTYLAQVTAVTPLRTDAAGHVIVPASMTLAVYNDDNGTSIQTYTISGNDYSVGQYILISAVSATTNNSQNVYGTNASGTNFVLVDNPGNDVVHGVADSLIGTQTVLHSNRAQHVVNGTTYDDANALYLDQANNETVEHTWLFDQYNNLIGVIDNDVIYNYGTIQDIQWVNPVGESGYARATLALMDGSTTTAEVYSIVSGTTTYTLTYWDGASTLAVPAVSTTKDQNYTTYAGQQLYRIETRSDGSVVLNMVQDITPAIGDELTDADVKDGVSAITGNEGTIYTNNNTQYLIRVKTATAGVYTFTAVTGFNNLDENYIDSTTNNVIVDYVDNNNDGFAEYVYIIGDPESTTGWSLFYLTDSDVVTYLNNNNVAYYELTGYVDGVPGTIRTTDSTIMTAIINGGVGKMSVVYYEDGMVVANGSADYNLTRYKNLDFMGGQYTGMAISTYFQTRDTIGAGVTSNATAVVEGGVLKVRTGGGTTVAYNLVDVVALGGGLPDSGTVTNKAIYVVYGNRGTNGEFLAATAYVVDYAIQDAGDRPVTPPASDWVNSPSTSYWYSMTAKELYTTSDANDLEDLASTFSGVVVYRAPGSTAEYTVEAGDTDALAKATINSLLRDGYEITLYNGTGNSVEWTIVLP